MCFHNIYSQARMENPEQLLCGSTQSQDPHIRLHSKYCCTHTNILPHENLCKELDLMMMTAAVPHLMMMTVAVPHLMMPVAVTNHFVPPSVVVHFFARQ